MSKQFKQIESKEELVEALKNDNVYIKFKRKAKPDEYKKSEHSGKTTFDISDGPDLFNMFKLKQYYKKIDKQEAPYAVGDTFVEKMSGDKFKIIEKQNTNEVIIVCFDTSNTPRINPVEVKDPNNITFEEFKMILDDWRDLDLEKKDLRVQKIEQQGEQNQEAESEIKSKGGIELGSEQIMSISIYPKGEEKCIWKRNTIDSTNHYFASCNAFFIGEGAIINGDNYKYCPNCSRKIEIKEIGEE